MEFLWQQKMKEKVCLNLAERFLHSLEEMLKNAPEVESGEAASQVELLADVTNEAGDISPPGEWCGAVRL